MPENTSFSDDAEQLNEQLSAYIDGELSPEETIVLEQRLAADEKLRKRLAGLKNNWGLLESLPRENVSSRFTASTVEMVAIRATANNSLDTSTAIGWASRNPRWLFIIAAALLAGFFGYVATRVITNTSPVNGLLENRNALLIKHLNFLEHFPEYQLTDNINFLKKLYQIEYFSSRTQVAAYPAIVKQAQDSNEEARTRILGMNSGEKNRVHRNYLGFLQLPEPEQKRLLILHDTLLAAPNTEVLSKVLITYSRWYQQLDPLEQVEITLRNQNEKIDYIQKLILSQAGKAKFITEKDLIVINRWLGDVARRNEKTILRELDKNRSDAISRLNNRDKSRQLVKLLVKLLNRNPRLLMNPNERKQYQLMKSSLSEAFQQNLARQPNFDRKINLLIETTRRAYRDNRSRNTGPNKRYPKD
ncbi:MAG: hypothetical protein P8M53_13240 [Pirellulales bacterium]|nr:hypothetical protein [Pirellulales bacterium]